MSTETIISPAKSVPLFYFSGTGNTWWISQALYRALNARGVEAISYSIEQVTREQTTELIQQADIIGLGFSQGRCRAGGDLAQSQPPAWASFTVIHPGRYAGISPKIPGSPGDRNNAG